MPQHGVVPDGIAVVATEPVAPIVPVASALGSAGKWFVLSGNRIDTQVQPANIDFVARLLRQDDAASIAVRDVQPVIEAPGKPVDAMLLVGTGEAGIPRFALVRFPVAIGVFGVKNFRRGSDEDALVPDLDPGWIAESIQECCCLIVATVAIRIRE